MELAIGIVLGGLVGWAIAHQYYVRATLDAKEQADKQDWNSEILAEYMMRRDRGEEVEIVRDPEGGLKNLNVQIRVSSATLQFSERSADLTDGNAEKKTPD